MSVAMAAAEPADAFEMRLSNFESRLTLAARSVNITARPMMGELVEEFRFLRRQMVEEHVSHMGATVPASRTNGKHTGWSRKNPAPGVRMCARCHELLPVTAFKPKTSKKPDELRSFCDDCWKEYQRDRYVRVGETKVSIEVHEGDGCVGARCPGCRRRFEVGDRIVADQLRHVACDTNEKETA